MTSWIHKAKDYFDELNVQYKQRKIVWDLASYFGRAHVITIRIPESEKPTSTIGTNTDNMSMQSSPSHSKHAYPIVHYSNTNNNATSNTSNNTSNNTNNTSSNTSNNMAVAYKFCPSCGLKRPDDTIGTSTHCTQCSFKFN